MADKPATPLSSSLLARKGAASADGFAFARPDGVSARRRWSHGWRLTLFSATLAVSVGVISFVGAALIFRGPSAPSVAPANITRAPGAAAVAALEHAAGPASPVPHAVAVANDSGERDATETDETVSAPPAIAVAMTETSDPTPLPEQAKGEAAEQTASLRPDTAVDRAVTPPAAVEAVMPPPVVASKPVPPPPSPKKRPRVPQRAGYRVQLYALASDAAVRREWRRLRRAHEKLLSGLKLTVSPLRPDSGKKTYYRMQIGALSSRTEAQALCRELRQKKMSCMVVR
ncbi:MAG: SPOR domain-containing protein [Rhodospirillales bacterium]|nr:SPOR domain-containing protein [Rhodospirillales bacterium]